MIAIVKLKMLFAALLDIRMRIPLLCLFLAAGNFYCFLFIHSHLCVGWELFINYSETSWKASIYISNFSSQNKSSHLSHEHESFLSRESRIMAHIHIKYELLRAHSVKRKFHKSQHTPSTVNKQFFVCLHAFISFHAKST